jgi:RimJ/RimL family protein N-acetyltransferase
MPEPEAEQKQALRRHIQRRISNAELRPSQGLVSQAATTPNHDDRRQNVGQSQAPAIEVGWRLRRDAWGHGYATEGARVAPQGPTPVRFWPGHRFHTSSG